MVAQTKDICLVRKWLATEDIRG